ncbi:MAG TPA: HupE/UreJ family protein [Flavobacterium sp.]|uniref:HupE/UreJ family protein n=1 Tax=Flavobacterium sp. TaxID=239 RepID=UPI002CB120B5|nr:HupE/UreJ family protein [Flavobacterium sp.]HNP32063.1 HupE/UreJ family protein [Flavobacterium sp.]
MSDFWINFTIGLKHLWNLNAYIDILFLLALTVPYEFKSWKRILVLLSLFTAGHTLALMLSVFNIVTIKTNIVAFIVPTIILIIALFNLVAAGKSGKKDSITFIAIVTSLFGIIHGLGFSNYFNLLITGKPTDKLLPLFESSLGFFVSQILAVTAALFLAHIVQTLLKFSKRDWILIISAFVSGIVIPMIIRSEIWVK